jgi:hypothetical protein
MKRILVVLITVTVLSAALYVGATNLTLRVGDLSMKAPAAAPVDAGSNILTVGLDNIAAVGGDLLVTP